MSQPNTDDTKKCELLYCCYGTKKSGHAKSNTDVLDEILEEMHEKVAIGWVKNDGKVHTLPTHANGDVCVTSAKAKIQQLYILKSDVEEAIGKDEPEISTQGDYYKAYARNQQRQEIRAKLGLKGEVDNE